MYRQCYNYAHKFMHKESGKAETFYSLKLTLNQTKIVARNSSINTPNFCLPLTVKRAINKIICEEVNEEGCKQGEIVVCEGLFR